MEKGIHIPSGSGGIKGTDMDEKKKKHQEQFWELFRYGIVGVSVTVLNLVLYYLLSRYTAMHYVIANVISFLLANLYAFFTNKVVVLQSKDFSAGKVAAEAVGFFTARGLSGLLDLAILLVGVSLLHIPDMPVKFFSSVVIILLNYMLSKFIIFKKKGG